MARIQGLEHPAWSGGGEQCERGQPRWGLCRMDISKALPGNIILGPFQLDERRKKVWVMGKEQALSPKLFDLLRIFLCRPGIAISTTDLAVAMSPVDEQWNPAGVKQCVNLLRQTIEFNPIEPRWLKDVGGFGYRLSIEPL